MASIATARSLADIRRAAAARINSQRGNWGRVLPFNRRDAETTVQASAQAQPAVMVTEVSALKMEKSTLLDLYKKSKTLAKQFSDLKAADFESQDLQHTVSKVPVGIQTRLGDISLVSQADYKPHLGTRLAKMLKFTFSRASDFAQQQDNTEIVTLANECAAMAASLENELIIAETSIVSTNDQSAPVELSTKDTASATTPAATKPTLGSRINALWNQAKYVATHKKETAQKIKAHVIENRHGIAAGMVTGIGIRTVFAAAALSTTLPLAVGVAVGAGIAARVASKAYQQYKTKQPVCYAITKKEAIATAAYAVGSLVLGAAGTELVKGAIDFFSATRIADVVPFAAAALDNVADNAAEASKATYALIEGGSDQFTPSQSDATIGVDTQAHTTPGTDLGTPDELGLPPVEYQTKLPTLPSAELAEGQTAADMDKLAETRPETSKQALVVVDALTKAKADGLKLIDSTALDQFTELKTKASAALGRGDMRSFVSSVSEAGKEQLKLANSREAGAALIRLAAATAEQLELPQDDAIKTVYSNAAFVEIHGKGTARNLIEGMRLADLAGDKGADLSKYARSLKVSPNVVALRR